jgi:hypothetical protein
LVAEADLQRVLPLLAVGNAMLSATFYHFREFHSELALTTVLEFLAANPGFLVAHQIDAYLDPIIDLLQEFWGDHVAKLAGKLIVSLERGQVVSEQYGLVDRFIRHLEKVDHRGIAIQTAIEEFVSNGHPVIFYGRVVARLLTFSNAEWLIARQATSFIQQICGYLPSGQLRTLLAHHSGGVIAAQDANVERYTVQKRQEEEEQRRWIATHQNTIRTSEDTSAVLDAFRQLKQEYWPDLTAERRGWLAQTMERSLLALDLANSIRWVDEHTWTRPHWLDMILEIIDYYTLRLQNDVPLVLALRAWPETAIIRYFQRLGFTPSATSQLEQLRGDPRANTSVTRNVLNFIDATNCSTARLDYTGGRHCSGFEISNRPQNAGAEYHHNSHKRRAGPKGSR